MGGNYTGADLPQQGRNSLKTHVMHHWSRMSCGPQGEGVQGCLAPGAPTEQALRKWCHSRGGRECRVYTLAWEMGVLSLFWLFDFWQVIRPVQAPVTSSVKWG